MASNLPDNQRLSNLLLFEQYYCLNTIAYICINEIGI